MIAQRCPPVVVPFVVALLLTQVVVGGTLFKVPLGLACVFAYARSRRCQAMVAGRRPRPCR